MARSKLIIALIPVLLLLMVSILIVPTPISLFTKEPFAIEILTGYRIPKALTALLTGAALSVSGFILQQLFRNALAGPYILGVSSGASLAVGLYVMSGSMFLGTAMGSAGLAVAGLAGAFVILLIVTWVSARWGYGSVILLFGIILGQITGALQTVLSYLALPGELKYFALWSMGSFSRVFDSNLMLLTAVVVAGLIWSYTLMPRLSVMVLGDDVATTLGINPKRTAFTLILCTGLLSGVTTAFCGPIVFIGMAVPNLCRLLYKTLNFRLMLIVNALFGAAAALLSDVMSSAELAGIHLPVNVCSAIIGGPFILYIILHKRN